MAAKFNIETGSLPINRSAGFHQKVLDGIQDLLLILAIDGRVLYASPMSFPLLEIEPEKLIGRYISTYMNVDDIPVWLEDFKSNMATGGSWRYHHRLRRRDDTYATFESTFKPYTDHTVSREAGLESSKLCLMTSRPYPVSSTSLMDSFLDHYTTHIRLSNQLQQLRKETAQDVHQTTTTTTRAALSHNGDTTHCATLTIEQTISENAPSDSRATKTTVSVAGSVTSHKRALSESSTSTKPQVDSVVGDIGLEITTSRLHTMQETGGWTARPRTKKRKEGNAPDHICKDCGTTDSPEWRKGPLGLKTLCNACGLRWSKSLRVPKAPQ